MCVCVQHACLLHRGVERTRWHSICLYWYHWCWKLLHTCWEWTLGLLEEQTAFLTISYFSKPYVTILNDTLSKYSLWVIVSTYIMSNQWVVSLLIPFYFNSFNNFWELHMSIAFASFFPHIVHHQFFLPFHLSSTYSGWLCATTWISVHEFDVYSAKDDIYWSLFIGVGR